MLTTATNPQQVQLGQHLRRARELSGLTQTAAAEALGVSPGAVNQYESGKRGVDALTLEKLGRVYNVPLSFFFGEEEQRADWEEALLARTAKLSPDVRDGIRRLITAIRDLALLHEKTGIKPTERPHQPFPALSGTVVPLQDVSTWADKTRRHFDLGMAPLVDLRSFLESQGFNVFAVPLGRGSDQLSGLMFRHPELGTIVAVNSDQAFTRRPFTMAHEFAHALFHYNHEIVLCRSSDRQPIEEFADNFAQFFLVPSEALFELLSRNNWRQVSRPEQVVHLARYFGVSYQAMLTRLRQEQKLSTKFHGHDVKPVTLAKALGYQPSRFEFGRLPWPPEERLPRVFMNLAREAVQEKSLSTQRVAEMMGISEYELTERLSPEENEIPEDICA